MIHVSELFAEKQLQILMLPTPRFTVDPEFSGSYMQLFRLQTFQIILGL